ncbi:MAG: type I methionyl aminopeptidase [Planctomycetes bacterium]|nr:type I methionyl aminopeptidase [Planctomycetota bacterium]
MPIVKSLEELEIMRSPGKIVGDALRLVESLIAPGVSTLELDQAVEAFILERRGTPAFKGYPSAVKGVAPFPSSICASINEEVVHGIPSAERILKNNDLISIDIGVAKDGFFGDAARTFAVGKPGRKTQRLLETGIKALEEATSFMRPGVPLSRISRAIQDCAEAKKYSVVKKFVGHGIGRAMHEPPQVPNFVSRSFTMRNIVMEVGMVLAIEPMINAGGEDVVVLEDGWTTVTRDRMPSVHFENSIAVGPEGPIILTA